MKNENKPRPTANTPPRAGEATPLLFCLILALPLSGAIIALSGSGIAAGILLPEIPFIPYLLISGICCGAAGALLLTGGFIIRIGLQPVTYIPRRINPLLRLFIIRWYPVCAATASLLRVPKERLACSFLKLNNRLNESWFRKGTIKNPLLLLPGCLQHHECPHRLGEDLSNCAGCGRCNVAAILQLKNRHTLTVVMATGGKRAQEAIRRNTPGGVIAVACEKELVQGIRESKTVPVIAVPNRQPNGPCRNTLIPMEELEKAITIIQGKKYHGGIPFTFTLPVREVTV